MPCAFLLFPFMHSGVPLYADECINEKSTCLFRPLHSVSRKSRHAEILRKPSLRRIIILNIIYFALPSRVLTRVPFALEVTSIASLSPLALAISAQELQNATQAISSVFVPVAEV